MGTTFSTIQIQNPNKAPQQQFKELLCKFFEAKGLVPATEEDAQFTYWLAFNEDNGWVTLGSGGYDLGEVHSDVPEIAKDLNTRCVLTSVWDSDFLEVKLFGSSPEQNDMIVAGQPYDADMVSEGNPELWKPLLAEGRTWEEVKEICGKDYTFAEGALLDLAPIFGMNPQSVTFEYNCSEEVSSQAQNVIDIHLKNAEQAFEKVVDIAQFKKNGQTSPAKPVSLNAAFKQVFGEALAPLGFVKIKGRHPYFVRLIGNEIIHVIALRKEYSGRRDWSEFNIVGGVATVYRKHIRLDYSPAENNVWLMYNRIFNVRSHPDYNRVSASCPIDFAYKTDNVVEVMKKSLEVTNTFMLPIINQANGIDACIEYFHKMRTVMSLHYGHEDYGNNWLHSDYNEGLLHILTNNRERYIELIERELQRELTSLEHSINSDDTVSLAQKDRYKEIYAMKSKTIPEEKPERIALANKIFDDKEWRAKVLVELERRKAFNTDILRTYGFNL